MNEVLDLSALVPAAHYEGMDEVGLCAVRARAGVDGAQPVRHMREVPALRGGVSGEASGVGAEARYSPCGAVLCDGMTAHVDQAHWSFTPHCAGCGRAK